VEKDLGLAGLADAIEALRTELLDAVNRGWNQSLRFNLAPIEITVQTVITRGVGGKLGWHVLGIEGKAESQHVHTLKLSLDPRMQEPDGSLSDVRVADGRQGGDAIRKSRNSLTDDD
jgi:hypothetical protein